MLLLVDAALLLLTMKLCALRSGYVPPCWDPPVKLSCRRGRFRFVNDSVSRRQESFIRRLLLHLLLQLLLLSVHLLLLLLQR